MPQLWYFRDSFLGLAALFGRHLVLALVLTERELWLLTVLRRGYVLRVIALLMTPLENLAREAEADLPMCEVFREREYVLSAYGELASARVSAALCSICVS